MRERGGGGVHCGVSGQLRPQTTSLSNGMFLGVDAVVQFGTNHLAKMIFPISQVPGYSPGISKLMLPTCFFWGGAMATITFHTRGPQQLFSRV